MKGASDISLVAQVAVLHNKGAFDLLVRKYQSPVRRFFLNLTLGDGQLSDDLAQDTFIKAYVNISQFRAVAGFSTWLYRIAYNVWYDHLRSEQRHIHASATLERADAATATPSSLAIDIYTALSHLREEERTCVVLQLIDGQKISAISRITGMAENTVKSHLKRGKDKLANYLITNGYDR